MLRATFSQPQRDGNTETLIGMDQETWLQIATTLHDQGGVLIGEYTYRDIQINSDSPPDQFSSSALLR
jgi:hypothetical protein